MTGTMALLLFVFAFLALLPYAFFRGRTLRRYAATDAGVWALIAALALLTRDASFDAYLVLIAIAVAKLALFSLFLAVAEASDVRWSANRAALLALAVYACAIPAMMQFPIDGDEPFYLLVTESLVHDRDLDLSNQYAHLATSATQRTDLRPQDGDPVGRHGERYSRHEPFLSILLIPGFLAGGLAGALATMAIFGALLARATVRLFEDEGISDATTRALFPLIAFGPPILFFAVRIWPEVPAAWLLVEAVRGVRQRRVARWLPALFALVLLKLRFMLIAIVVVFRALAARRRLTAIQYAVVALLFVAPLAIVWAVSGSAMNVHRAGELRDPFAIAGVIRGLFGLTLDGAAGIAFQAPFYLLALFALTRWRSMPEGFRLGMSSVALYVLYLCPRPEWHGGWSPPLRYVTVAMPFLALGCATLLDRVRAFIAPIAVTTIGLVIHGLAFPWRLFHIANGESSLGEWLSLEFHADVSRLIPSFIRLNTAAIVASIVLVICLIASRFVTVSRMLIAPALTLLLAFGIVVARRPAAQVNFEDAHVIHRGGELYPWVYEVARYVYRGGWLVTRGNSLTFLARGGTSTLEYASKNGATISLGGKTYTLPPTGGQFDYGSIRVDLPRDGRTELRCLGGDANLDRMVHDAR
jgi:hypothetical protein